MNLKQSLYILGFTLSTATFNANAALTSYTANGVDLVRMQGAGFDVSFTKDGNLFQTLASSYAGGASAFVDAVIASAGGKITDMPNQYDAPVNSGYHTLSSSDFNTSTGQVSWFGAKAYVSYLNNISYGGSNQWRLPTSNGIFGYDGTAGNELGQLFYSELGGTEGNSIPNTVTFNNEQTDAYWSGTEYAFNPNIAWYFDTYNGYQYNYYKFIQFYAWAVSPGQVAAVPVPGAVWLMGSGLLGILGLKRRQS